MERPSPPLLPRRRSAATLRGDALRPPLDQTLHGTQDRGARGIERAKNVEVQLLPDAARRASRAVQRCYFWRFSGLFPVHWPTPGKLFGKVRKEKTRRFKGGPMTDQCAVASDLSRKKTSREMSIQDCC